MWLVVRCVGIVLWVPAEYATAQELADDTLADSMFAAPLVEAGLAQPCDKPVAGIVLEALQTILV